MLQMAAVIKLLIFRGESGNEGRDTRYIWGKKGGHKLQYTTRLTLTAGGQFARPFSLFRLLPHIGGIVLQTCLMSQIFFAKSISSMDSYPIPHDVSLL